MDVGFLGLGIKGFKVTGVLASVELAKEGALIGSSPADVIARGVPSPSPCWLTPLLHFRLH